MLELSGCTTAESEGQAAVIEQVEELFYCDPKSPPSATSPQPLHARCETLDETGEEWECPQCCDLEKGTQGTGAFPYNP